MTGLHTGHARIRDNHGRHGRVPLRREDLTVAEVLQRAGYRTGLIGKWGLGEAGTTGVPTEKGFDEFFGFLSQDHALEYYPTHLWDNRTEWFPPGNQGAKRKQYVQDLFTERALKFVRENAAAPFFLYLAYTIPHASSELGRDTGDGFVVPDYEPYSDKGWPRPERGFAAMIHRLDRDVGRLAQELDRLGVGRDTLLIFSSDNGPAQDGGHSPEFFQSSGGLRGKKGDLYEGGIRVPFIARWPDRIAAGGVANDIIAFWDFLPTAAELAGTPVPRNLDGRSFRSVLMGSSARQGTSVRTDPLYWESPKSRGVVQASRLGSWKAIRTAGKPGVELYNLAQDRGETQNMAASHPAIVDQMEKILRESHHGNEDYPSVAPGN